jgi:hypothetical protein
LRPVNREFDPIVLTGKVEDEVQVIAELAEVLGLKLDGDEGARG